MQVKHLAQCTEYGKLFKNDSYYYCIYIYTYIYIVYVGMCKDGNTYTYNPCMFSRQKNTAIQ